MRAFTFYQKLKVPKRKFGTHWEDELERKQSSVFVFTLKMSESSSEQGGFVVDEAAYQRYKSIIEAAKAQKKAEIFRKPTRASGVLEKDARVSLQAADEAFECQEWSDAMQIYEDW